MARFWRSGSSYIRTWMSNILRARSGCEHCPRVSSACGFEPTIMSMALVVSRRRSWFQIDMVHTDTFSHKDNTFMYQYLWHIN